MRKKTGDGRRSDVLDIIRSRDERGVFIRLDLSGKVRGMILRGNMRLTGKERLRGRKQQQKREKKDIGRGENQEWVCSERARGKDTSLSGYAYLEIILTISNWQPGGCLLRLPVRSGH